MRAFFTIPRAFGELSSREENPIKSDISKHGQIKARVDKSLACTNKNLYSILYWRTHSRVLRFILLLTKRLQVKFPNTCNSFKRMLGQPL